MRSSLYTICIRAVSRRWIMTHPRHRLLSSWAVRYRALDSNADPTIGLNDMSTIFKQVANGMDTKSINRLFSKLDSDQAQELYDRAFRHGQHTADMDTYLHLLVAHVKDNRVQDAMDIYYQLSDRAQMQSAENLCFFDKEQYMTIIEALVRLPPQPSLDHDNVSYMVRDDDEVIGSDQPIQPALRFALNLVHDLRRWGIPTSQDMYLWLIQACAKSRDETALEHIHRLLRIDLHVQMEESLYAALVDAYEQVGDGAMARQMKDIMQPPTEE